MNFWRMVVCGALLSVAAAEDWKPLWEGEAPGAARPKEGAETKAPNGTISQVEQPEYLLYPAPEGNRTGQGMVIFPGGGYGVLAIGHEGHAYAKWLNERGITAMVVKYRVSRNDEFGYQYPVPFLDARRAIRTMRSRAGEFGVDPAKVGVMGSSAGGHLASMCATLFDESFPEEGKDEIDKSSCRPDFAVLVYPVITMGELGHGGSRVRLLGKTPEEEMIEKLSTEKQMTKNTPPCFLLMTSDDFVDCRNSLLFAAACKANGVPVSLHMFEKGGHGYGLKGQKDLAMWPELLEAWLKR